MAKTTAAPTMLVISEFYETNANVIRDFLFSFHAWSRFRTTYLFSGGLVDDDPDLDAYDVILLFWSVRIFGHDSFSATAIERIRRSPALKVLFLQDEYRRVHQANDFMVQAGVQVMFTCVPEEDHEVFYPRARIPGLEGVYTVLTGYVPSYLERSRLDLEKLDMKRPVDIGYRSRILPPYLGDLGREKILIAERFQELAPPRGFTVDISVRVEDRFYGKKWIDFLRSCNFTLGSGSGASVIDFTGDVQRQCEDYSRKKGNATYEEVKELFFAELDWKYKLDVISPRAFEAAALGNVMVMHEAPYSGLLSPDVHYILVKKDYSNIDEVFEKMRDRQFCRTLARNSYEDLIRSGRHNYPSFVRSFDDLIERHLAGRPRRTGSPSSFAFYLRRYLRSGEFLVPRKDGYAVLPNLRSLGFSVSSFIHRYPALNRQLFIQGGEFFKNLAGRQVLLFFPWLRALFKAGRKIRNVDRRFLLDEVLKLNFLWQARTGALAGGASFTVATDFRQDESVLRFHSHPLGLDTESPVSAAAPADGDIKACAAGASHTKDFLPLRIEWNHAEVDEFFSYPLTYHKWLFFYPEREGVFRFETLEKIGENCPAVVQDALAATVEGRETPSTRLFSRMNHFIFLLGTAQSKLYLLSFVFAHKALIRLLSTCWRRKELRRSMSFYPLLKDLTLLGVAATSFRQQRERLLFAVLPMVEGDRLLLQSRCFAGEEESGPERGTVEEAIAALREGRVGEIRWDHSAVDEWFLGSLGKGRTHSVHLGKGGIYSFSALSSLLPTLSREVADAVQLLFPAWEKGNQLTGETGFPARKM